VQAVGDPTTSSAEVQSSSVQPRVRFHFGGSDALRWDGDRRTNHQQEPI
jgi:hypothetical protein